MTSQPSPTTLLADSIRTTSPEPEPVPQSPRVHHQDSNEIRPRRRVTTEPPRHESTQARTPPRPSRGLSLASTRSTLQSMLRPEKKVGPAPGLWRSIVSIILSSWINLLLVFIPISWAFHFAKQSDTLIFVFSFLAIIPLAKLLAFATDELSMRVGQTLAGFINATLGNAVELIVAIIALTQCKLHIVQSSLVGSVLSNLLLVLGMCFFAGGLKYSEQGFGLSATQLNSSLLTISVIAVLLPAAFHVNVSASTDNNEADDILKMSRGVSIILLFIYFGYLIFQLHSHTNLYEDDSGDAFKSTRYVKSAEPSKISNLVHNVGSKFHRSKELSESDHSHDVEGGAPEQKEEEEEEQPQLSLWVALGLLAVVTVLVAITAEWLVDSIDGLTEHGHISQEFVGVILLPIVGNAAEHATAVTVSVKDKLTLSLGVAVGSSIQIALFVIPFIVTLAWILGKPLTLLFDPYESITMFLAVLTVNYVVQDGKSNWLEGFLLMCLYVILGVTFYFYPGSDPSGVLAKCT